MRLADLALDRRAAVEAVLEPGETVRWLGLPDPARSPGTTGASFTLAFLWLGIVGLWQAGALTAALVSGFWQAWFYVGIGSVFMAIGLLFLWRAVAERRSAARRVHIVTDRRLLTLDLADPAASLALAGDRIGYAEPVTRPGGHGDIEIGHGASGLAARDATGFHHFRGVADVNGAIRALRLIVADSGRSLVTEAPDD